VLHTLISCKRRTHCLASSPARSFLRVQSFILIHFASMVTPTVFLPLELWLNVLRQHTDPVHLWLSCRQVSSAWRDEVNKIFAARYLQNHRMTELMFDIKPSRPLTMHFDHFDLEDPTRCTFFDSPSPFDLDDKARDPPSPPPPYPPQAAWIQRCKLIAQMRISQ